jgi:hypothetical protein
MPTISSIRSLFEQEQTQQEKPETDLIRHIIMRFPYKDYGISQDDDDKSLVVTFPGGMRIRMQQKSVEFYAQVTGAGADHKEDYAPVISKLEEAEKMTDSGERTVKLKEVSRHFAAIEYRQDKYSFIAYVMGQQKLTVDSMRAIYTAYASDDPSKLSPGDKKLYDKALSYALSYYKFLAGMLSVID